MSGPAYLAWRYLARHKAKTSILVLSIALIGFLPSGLRVLVARSAEQLTARAEATPLLVGARGSRLDLVLAALYFEADPPETIAYAELERVAETGFAEAIPLHVRFRVRDVPVVGTTLAYLETRGLRLAAGRPMAVLGECVVGAAAARRLGVSPGDALVTAPETVFDLAGTYPLRMNVSGVLAPSHSPDDDAVFVDLKTAWIIEGLGHGHQDLDAPEAESAVIARKGDRITANASLVEYNEITPENIGSFHFHGDLSQHPIHAVLAVPRDARGAALLRGRFEGPDEPSQIVRPGEVVGELLATVVTIEGYVSAALGTVAVATLAVAALVFLLSLRLRRREVETLVKLGGARSHVAAVLASEMVSVLVLGATLAGGLTWLASRFGAAAIRTFLLS